MFSSPCGVWIVSNQVFCDIYFKAFSSPCGVWIVSGASTGIRTSLIRFRPLAGCELFLIRKDVLSYNHRVFVPLRGVDCFYTLDKRDVQLFLFSSPYGVWIVSLRST